MYSQRPYAQSNRRPRHHDRRPRQEQTKIPSTEQITQLMKNLHVPTPTEEYNPDHWSILPTREQQLIEQVVWQVSIYELSIHYVLQVTRLRNTPSVFAFIVDCIKRRYNTPILPLK
ncbi:hypothetical protein EBU71_22580 [bacterium]|nr:hypothetical protein [Candidatus Elulimicrobium humile]